MIVDRMYIESAAYSNFLAALDQKSMETKRTYQESFKLFLQYSETQDPELLVKKEPKQLQQLIRQFMAELKEKGLSYSTINKAYWAVRKFYAANEVVLNWDWIGLYKPKKEEKEQEDRPYRKEEIAKCLAEADQRTKTAIVIMATGGCRVGALTDIRIKDLEYIEKYNLYCITVYPLDQNTRYRTFVTPQATEIINQYRGKHPDRGDYLFVRRREPDLAITKAAIEIDIWRLLVDLGLRSPKPKNSYERHPVMMDHGFRKFATTVWASSGVEKEYREALDGHNPGIQKRYAKLSALELLETSRYPLAIKALTF